ncbi:MAG: DNA topoisomerase VI subunit B [Zestosphaera sp.]
MSEVESIEKFRALSPSEFFYRNREIAGFSNPARALYQTVRELVENALDATDTHHILPDIKVIIKSESSEGLKTSTTNVEDTESYEGILFSVQVEDNGIGLPPQHVPRAFGQLLYSSKYVLRQSRGMFGLGAKMAILYGQITTGRPAEVITSQILSKKIYYFKVSIDIASNTPIIHEFSIMDKNSEWHGTAVKIYLIGDWQRSKQKIYDYLKRTAIIAPYANIYFEDPEGNIVMFKRSTEEMPVPPREVKPHPYGVDIELLKRMLADTSTKTLLEFLVKEFQNVGELTALKILESARLKPDLKPSELTLNDVTELMRSIKSSKIKAPSGKHLSFLGEKLIVLGLRETLKPEYAAAITRKANVYEGHAFIVEAGIAYGGKIPSVDKPLLLRYANKIPLLYDESADVMRKVVDTIEWNRYGVVLPAQLAVLIHVCSTKVPYKGVGKEAVADVPEVEKEIELAVREVARKLKSYLVRKAREYEEAEKAVTIAKYIPDVARSLHVLSDSKFRQEDIERELLQLLNRKLTMLKIKSLKDIVVEVS